VTDADFMRKPDRVAAAVFVAVLAFLLYRATMLPGLELGDSASFQVRVGSPVVTPRDGYPLYFAVGSLFLRATGEEPAHALNLASAALGAVASGLIVVVAAELAGSVFAGAEWPVISAFGYSRRRSFSRVSFESPMATAAIPRSVAASRTRPRVDSAIVKRSLIPSPPRR